MGSLICPDASRTDNRPLAITCAPCRTRKISESSHGLVLTEIDVQSAIVKSQPARTVTSKSMPAPHPISPKEVHYVDFIRTTLMIRSPHECYYPVKLKPGLRPGAGMDVMRRVGESPSSFSATKG